MLFATSKTSTNLELCNSLARAATNSLALAAKAARLTLPCLSYNLSSELQVALDVVFALVAYFVEYCSSASWVWSTTSDFNCSNKNTVEVTSGAPVVVHFVESLFAVPNWLGFGARHQSYRNKR